MIKKEQEEQENQENASTVDVLYDNTRPTQDFSQKTFWNKVANRLPLVVLVFVLPACLLVSWHFAESCSALCEILERKDVYKTISQYSAVFFGFSLTSISIMLTNLKDKDLQDIAKSLASDFIWHSNFLAIILALVFVSSIVIMWAPSIRHFLVMGAWFGLLLASSVAGFIWLVLFLHLAREAATALEK